MKRHVAAVTAAITLVVGVPAQAADPGLTVLGFLKLGAGARPASLGGAYVAAADDASATYWNPAALLNIERFNVMGSHLSWIQDLRQEFVAFGAHTGSHAFGVSFLGLFTDDIQGRTETGDLAGNFSFSNGSFSGSYAYQLGQVGLGGTVRYVREALGSVPISVDGTSQSDFVLDGVLFDIGTSWRPDFMTGVTFAAALRNLGGQLSYDFSDATAFDPPSTLQAGFAYRRVNVNGGGLMIAADVIAARGDDASVRVGAEYAYRGQFMIDAGYKSGFDNQDLSFGLGYTNKIQVQYAFVPVSDDLGNAHQFTLGYAW